MQVHRFRNLIAVHVNRKGETAYLTEAEAGWLIAALAVARESVRTEEFTANTCGTHSRELTPDAFSSARATAG